MLQSIFKEKAILDYRGDKTFQQLTGNYKQSGLKEEYKEHQKGNTKIL